MQELLFLVVLVGTNLVGNIKTKALKKAKYLKPD